MVGMAIFNESDAQSVTNLLSQQDLNPIFLGQMLRLNLQDYSMHHQGLLERRRLKQCIRPLLETKRAKGSSSTQYKGHSIAMSCIAFASKKVTARTFRLRAPSFQGPINSSYLSKK